MNLISLMGAWYDAILNFGQTLIMYILEALKLIFVPIYFIFMGVCWLISFSENVFKAVAGIDKIYLNGTALGGGSGDGKDLVYAFITDASVQNVFWSILALSLLLLFIFTIVAMIKSEFTIDLKGSAKGPIIGRALKSLVNFLVVPVTTLISIIGVNYLSKTIYDLFAVGNNSFVSKCFYVGGYNANRARRDEDFIKLINDSDFVESNPFGSGSAQSVANAIDDSFTDFKMWNFKAKKVPPFGDGNKAELEDEKGYTDWHTLILGAPQTSSNKTFSIWNVRQVNYFYNLVYFDYILAVGSAIVLAWTLLSVCLVLVKRVFELAILFLLAPPMIAIAPLDGGQAEKKWRGEFMKRLLSVLGTVFSYNMYFLFVPLFENISLFSGVKMSFDATAGAVAGGVAMLGSYQVAITDFLFVFDIFFQLICVIVGAGIIKSASALISTLLGVEDLVKSGGEAAKKAVDIGKKAALGATAIGGVAVKGGAAVLKGVGGVAKRIGNSKYGQKVRQGAKGLLEKAGGGIKKLGEKTGITGLAKRVANSETVDNLKKWGTRRKNDLIEFGGKIKNAGKRVKGVLQNAGLMKEDISAEMDALDTKQYGERDKDGNVISRGLDGDYADANDAYEAADREYQAAEAAGDKKAMADADEKRKSAAAKRDSVAASIEAINQQRAAARKRVAPIWSTAFASEFGEDAQTDSFGAKLTGSKMYKKLLGNSLFGKSMAEWLNPEGQYAKRRLNDALSGLFGDGGGGDLWKIWFNKNARAALYEGVPESKTRSAKIDAANSWGGKKKYDEDEAKKAAKEKELVDIRNFLARSEGGSFAAKYASLSAQLLNEKNPLMADKLKDQIKTMEDDRGLTKRAKEFYDSMKSNPEQAEAYREYKRAMEKHAQEKERLEGEAAEEKNFQRQRALAEKYGPAVVGGGGGGSQEVKTVSSDTSNKNLANEIANALKKNPLRSTVENAVKLNADAFQPIVSGFSSLKSSLDALADSLKKLTGDDKPPKK